MELNESKKFLKDNGAIEVDVMISQVNEKEGLTEEIIDELIETYNPEKFEVPNVLGHPPFEDNTPAYGWVKKLYRKGKDLFERATLFPEMIKLIKSGAFKKRSIAWFLPKHPSNPYPGKNTLMHVGWLGAILPAIKGMPNIKLSENNAEGIKIVEFSESKKEEKNLKKEKLMEFTEQQLSDRIKTEVDAVIVKLSDSHKVEVATLSDGKKKSETEVEKLKTNIEEKDKEIKTFAEKEYEHEVEKVMLSDLKLKIIPANKDKVSASLLKIRNLSEEDFKDQVEIYKSQPDVIKLGKLGEAEGELNTEILTQDDEDFGLTKEDVKKYAKQVNDKAEGGE